jgi:hypothetical protein
MMIFEPELLAVDLRTYGEDELASKVPSLDSATLERIGRRAGELVATTPLWATALVRAAIEILEGGPREPRWKRRRLKGIYPGM